MTMRDRALAALRGETPARLPFITRLETWYKGHIRRNTLPERFRGLSLDELHHKIGVGRLKFTVPFALRLRDVELRVWHNGELLLHTADPLVENFPGMWDFVSSEQPGVTETELRTARGKLTLQHALLEENVQSGTEPYLKRHLIQDERDYPVVEYILERAEFTPLFSKMTAEEAQLGNHGLLVPLLQRIPFQQVLLEYLGEAPLFYALHDQPQRVRRLLDLLDAQMLDFLPRLRELNVPYIEFPDNLHGLMTNPRLFREFCLPAYQRYTEILHGQGKKVGSHMDGDVRPLLALVAQSGLDVCESFSPSPLTACTFTEAWQAWSAGPLIWGGIPSPILEEGTSQADFEAAMQQIFAASNRPLILGVVDLLMVHNLIERVEAIARWVEMGKVVSQRAAQTQESR
jgi:hypothetical protein